MPSKVLPGCKLNVEYYQQVETQRILDMSLPNPKTAKLG